jgi:hypothetical protein
MVREEVGSKIVRFLYFSGAGGNLINLFFFSLLFNPLIRALIVNLIEYFVATVVCTKAINMWREYEHKQAIAEAAKKLNGSPQVTVGTVNEAPAKS